jgi:DNA-binding transcriptional ArsR family regulator
MSIASALFSDSQSRVFRWLFGQPERAFHLSELRRLTGLGSASVQRELNRLAEAGLVRSERVGNLRRFPANAQSPVYGELVGLARKTLGVEPVLREALRLLVPSLQAAWGYGSVAKQTDTAQSDIDVMLVGKNLRLSKILELLVPLEAAAIVPEAPGLLSTSTRLPSVFEAASANARSAASVAPPGGYATTKVTGFSGNP